MSETQLEASRTINAPAERIFALLADPTRHTAIDGSGMLQGSDSEPLTSVGQVFAMKMYREDLGHYQTLNTVSELEPGRAIGWAPDLDPDSELKKQMADITIGGHTYSYRLREADGATEVTQVYDWSGVTDPNFAAICPVVSTDELAATLERLAGAVES